MCGSETCPCKWHSMKISNDFVDILNMTISLEEEQEIIERINQSEGDL